MTGPEHYLEAERLDRQADQWMNDDRGWKAHLSVEERLAYRKADQDAAQFHATMALVAATVVSAPVEGEPDSGLPARDAKVWYNLAGVKQAQAPGDDE
ncbi:hypothetical protein ABZ829_28170 [Streptomyces xanthochromogenes]|uniref:hypothetical protein n=1 Tax=Streptomyces xanthochromogenes TaxID=67384 RepID=UPI00343A22D2